MEANPARIIEYFNGEKQSLVPLFQRPYTWKKDHWSRLWEDIMVQYDQDDNAGHFLGAIVTIPARTVPVGVSKYLIIDGQQRLTSISLLLCAIRDTLASYDTTDEKKNAARVQNVYLINEYSESNEKLKFMPTQIDRHDYKTIVLEKELPESEGNIVKAYKFFLNKLKTEKDSGDNLIDASKVLIALERTLQVVMINLGDVDDPYLIFESLNFKGQPLTQADLVRNYLLMKFRHEMSSGGEQERIYDTYWRPMEDVLGVQLTEFLRYYILKDGIQLRQDAIYTSIKERFKSIEGQEQAEEEIKRIKHFADLFALCVEPLREQSLSVRGLLSDLRDLKTSTSYSFVLKLLDARARNLLEEDELCSCLKLVQSFVLRRAVCGVPTNALNKIFPQWAKNVDENNIYAWLAKAMKEGKAGSRFPTDTEFESALVHNSQYGKPSTRFILERIEASFNHKERIDLSASELSIEHIMPQTLTSEWKSELGENFSETHGRLLNTIGNLTLTGYNSELSNEEFSEKRAILQNTHLEMNRHIANQEHWDEQAIISRAKELFQVARKIWEYPS